MNIYLLAALRIVGYIVAVLAGIAVVGWIICGPAWVFPSLASVLVLSGLYAWELDDIKRKRGLK